MHLENFLISWCQVVLREGLGPLLELVHETHIWAYIRVEAVRILQSLLQTHVLRSDQVGEAEGNRTGEPLLAVDKNFEFFAFNLGVEFADFNEAQATLNVLLEGLLSRIAQI